jgi:hypothetical protein
MTDRIIIRTAQGFDVIEGHRLNDKPLSCGRKIFAKCFARAIAKVSAEQDAAISAQEPYRVANHQAFALPRYCLA